MTELQKRIFEKFDLYFWRSAVRVLKLTGPLKKIWAVQVEDLLAIQKPKPTRFSSHFRSGILTATLAWIAGITLGYLIALWGT